MNRGERAASLVISRALLLTALSRFTWWTALLWLMVFFPVTSTRAADPVGLEIFFIDVEGGAATLIVTHTGESLLVDTGNPGMRDATRIHKVATEVAALKRIDHCVTTHWHVDHYGGVATLAGKMPIARFYDRGIPERLAEDKQYFPLLIPTYRKLSLGKRQELSPGDKISLQQGDRAPALDVLCLTASGKVYRETGAATANSCCGKHQPKPLDPSDNAKSISLLLTYGSFKFLDCGDLTWNVEYDLVCPNDPIGKIDVFQVTHHGLDSSNNPVLVETVQPRVAIFNNGARKGAMPDVMRTLRRLPDLQAIYQLHRNEGVGAELNTDPMLIANPSAKCEGQFIRLTVAPDGKSYSVRVGADGPARRYTTR